MEQLDPLLELIRSVRGGVESGEAVHTILKQQLSRNSRPFDVLNLIWFRSFEEGRPPADSFWLRCRPHHRAALNIFDRGLRGAAILSQLVSLEREVIDENREKMEEFVQKLPLQMLIPLLFFLFPAFIILLLGPLIDQMLSGLSF